MAHDTHGTWHMTCKGGWVGGWRAVLQQALEHSGTQHVTHGTWHMTHMANMAHMAHDTHGTHGIWHMAHGAYHT